MVKKNYFDVESCSASARRESPPACGMLVLTAFALVLAGCGSKNIADWMRSASYINEVRIVHGCAVAAENLDNALARLRESSLLPFGDGFAKAEPAERECGRYIILSTLSGAPEAVITLERRPDGDSNLTVYQQNGGSIHHRQFVAEVERWANGFVNAE